VKIDIGNVTLFAEKKIKKPTLKKIFFKSHYRCETYDDNVIYAMSVFGYTLGAVRHL
jgi:hypothetical protein